MLQKNKKLLCSNILQKQLSVIILQIEITFKNYTRFLLINVKLPSIRNVDSTEKNRRETPQFIF